MSVLNQQFIYLAGHWYMCWCRTEEVLLQVEQYGKASILRRTAEAADHFLEEMVEHYFVARLPKWRAYGNGDFNEEKKEALVKSQAQR